MRLGRETVDGATERALAGSGQKAQKRADGGGRRGEEQRGICKDQGRILLERPPAPETTQRRSPFNHQPTHIGAQPKLSKIEC